MNSEGSRLCYVTENSRTIVSHNGNKSAHSVVTSHCKVALTNWVKVPYPSNDKQIKHV